LKFLPILQANRLSEVLRVSAALVHAADNQSNGIGLCLRGASRIETFGAEFLSRFERKAQQNGHATKNLRAGCSVWQAVRAPRLPHRPLKSTRCLMTCFWQ
jgi:hypothetical protein